MSSLARLRAHAVTQSLFAPTTLAEAIGKLGFVQADPIRAPARAQDLILRQRAAGYRAGDLERRYAALDLEEDVLYAYGFVTREVWRLLHPRKTEGLSALERKVLDLVARSGPTHPSQLEEPLGRKRVVNAWGGFSKATTRALERLHHRGLLRVARRENGIRLYEATAPRCEAIAMDERLRKLIMVLVKLLAPIPAKTLHANIARFRGLGNTRAMVAEMVRVGELRQEMVDGLSYVWPERRAIPDDVPERVRLLAPFDPVVWDRLRFEHLWGWAYRFEAYTPAARRIRGYYALPMLWRNRVIGWANASVAESRLDVAVGFVDKRPREKAFAHELEAEISRFKEFLAV